jgi:hypothetical protein
MLFPEAGVAGGLSIQNLAPCQDLEKLIRHLGQSWLQRVWSLYCWASRAIIVTNEAAITSKGKKILCSLEMRNFIKVFKKLKV